MKPIEMSGRFAAYIWYTNNREAAPLTKQAEARRFADQSWQAFIPVAQEGLGRLLLRLAHSKGAKLRVKPQVEAA